jgi:hypothetical protein
MKNYLTILLVLGTLTAVQAQESPNKPRRWHRRDAHKEMPEKGGLRTEPWGFEVGVNATPVLRQLTRKAADSANLNPYLLSLRVAKGHWGIHAAAGGNRNHTLNRIEGFADNREIRSDELQLRTGLDYRSRLNKYFTVQVGADYVLHYANNTDINDSGYDVVEQIEQLNLTGAGLNLGLTYWATRRLGISTEANFQWLTGYRDSARKFKNFPELNDNLTYSRIDTVRKSVLGGVFVMYRF